MKIFEKPFWLLLLLCFINSTSFASAERTEERRLLRIEYLLAEAPPDKVVDFFKDEFPRVTFLSHPDLRGFYGIGIREDLLQLKRDLFHGGPPEPEPEAPLPNNAFKKPFRAVLKTKFVEPAIVLKSIENLVLPSYECFLIPGTNNIVITGEASIPPDFLPLMKRLDSPEWWFMDSYDDYSWWSTSEYY